MLAINCFGKYPSHLLNIINGKETKFNNKHSKDVLLIKYSNYSNKIFVLFKLGKLNVYNTEGDILSEYNINTYSNTFDICLDNLVIGSQITNNYLIEFYKFDDSDNSLDKFKEIKENGANITNILFNPNNNNQIAYIINNHNYFSIFDLTTNIKQNSEYYMDLKLDLLDWINNNILILLKEKRSWGISKIVIYNLNELSKIFEIIMGNRMSQPHQIITNDNNIIVLTSDNDVNFYNNSTFLLEKSINLFEYNIANVHSIEFSKTTNEIFVCHSHIHCELMINVLDLDTNSSMTVKEYDFCADKIQMVHIPENMEYLLK